MSSGDNASNDETDVEIKMEIPDRSETEIIYSQAKNLPRHIISNDPTFGIWTSEAESCLIKQYKKFKPMVGQTTRFKSFRDMFDTIAMEMQSHGFFFSPQKCENKWRVLERKYKALVMRESIKKPGRMKHYGRWQHRKAFDEIYREENKNVYLEKDNVILNTPTPIEESTTLSSSVESKQNLAANVIVAETTKIITEMKKLSDAAERNKERRHLEKMTVLKKQLAVQEKLLKIKEQKLELKRASIAVMARNIEQFS